MLNWLHSILNSDLTFIYILRAIAIILVVLGYGSFIKTVVFLARSTRAKGKLVAWNTLRPTEIRRGAPYTPGHPDDARIATIVNLWFMPVICSIIGSFLMVLWLH